MPYAENINHCNSIDDIMYIDPVVNEVSVDFIIVRPNKGALLVNVFEEDLKNCRLSQDKKDIFIFGTILVSTPIFSIQPNDRFWLIS